MSGRAAVAGAAGLPAHGPRLDRPALGEPSQIVSQFHGAGVATPGLLGQALQADRLQVAGHRRRSIAPGEIGSWWSSARSVSAGVSPGNGGRPGKHLVEDGPRA